MYTLLYCIPEAEACNSIFSILFYMKMAELLIAL